MMASDSSERRFWSLRCAASETCTGRQGHYASWSGPVTGHALALLCGLPPARAHLIACLSRSHLPKGARHAVELCYGSPRARKGPCRIGVRLLRTTARLLHCH